MDCVINGMKNRFSIESLKIGVGVDNFIQLKYEESIEFVNKYEVPNLWSLKLYIKIYFLFFKFFFLENIKHKSRKIEGWNDSPKKYDQ